MASPVPFGTTKRLVGDPSPKVPTSGRFMMDSVVCTKNVTPRSNIVLRLGGLAVANSTYLLARHGHPQLLALIDFRRHIFAKGILFGHEPPQSTLNHLAFEIPLETYEAHKQRLEALGLSPREVKFPAMTARALLLQRPRAKRLGVDLSRQFGWLSIPVGTVPHFSGNPGGLNGSSQHLRKPVCKNLKTLHFSRVLN